MADILMVPPGVFDGGDNLAVSYFGVEELHAVAGVAAVSRSGMGFRYAKVLRLGVRSVDASRTH